MDKIQIKKDMQNTLLACRGLKGIEAGLQEVIKKHLGGCWWEHTHYDIFWELLACNGLLMSILEFIDKLVEDLY